MAQQIADGLRGWFEAESVERRGRRLGRDGCPGRERGRQQLGLSLDALDLAVTIVAGETRTDDGMMA